MLRKQFHHLFYYPFTINLTLQPIGVIFINNWAMPIKEVVVIHCYLDQRCVTVNSLRDGIVLWELHHHCSNDYNDHNAFKIIIFLRSRSLPLLLKPDWSQSKHETRNTGHGYPNSVQCIVTTNSLGDGIVLWELQRQECQQRVCQHTDVVQTCQAGLWLLIIKWKMVKFTG